MMTTELHPRRPGRRSTAVLLSLALTGLGIAASPLVAGTAHAEAPSATRHPSSGVWISRRHCMRLGKWYTSG